MLTEDVPCNPPAPCKNARSGAPGTRAQFPPVRYNYLLFSGPLNYAGKRLGSKMV
jgi:hypothetical protein